MGTDPSQKNVANFTYKDWAALPLCTGYVIKQTKKDEKPKKVFAVKYPQERG